MICSFHLLSYIYVHMRHIYSEYIHTKYSTFMCDNCNNKFFGLLILLVIGCWSILISLASRTLVTSIHYLFFSNNTEINETNNNFVSAFDFCSLQIIIHYIFLGIFTSVPIAYFRLLMTLPRWLKILKEGALLFKLRLTADAAAAALAGIKSPASTKTPDRVIKKPTKDSTTTSSGTYGSLPIDFDICLKCTQETAEWNKTIRPIAMTTLYIGLIFLGSIIIFSWRRWRGGVWNYRGTYNYNINLNH